MDSDIRIQESPHRKRKSRVPYKYSAEDKSVVNELYWGQELSIPEVSRRLGIPKITVNRYLERKRTFSEAHGDIKNEP